MDAEHRQAYWQRTYQIKDAHEVSWTQDSPEPSLTLVMAAAPSLSTTMIDIGGGSSQLVDHLLQRGYRDVAVLDLSSAALAKAQARLCELSRSVDWIVADITNWTPSRAYDVWHDRATFHFMVTQASRKAYLACLRQGLVPGGYAVDGTFALDGPETCSGLPVLRYGPATLAQTLGPEFELVTSSHHLHRTPWGLQQSFQFSVFRRSSEAS